MEAMKKRMTTHSPKPESPKPATSPDSDSLEGLSPELVPIVTLLSSQAHRRYNEGIFMLYYDLNGDGKPADREWREVYGILTGNQLAYWDAANLAQFKNNPSALLETSSKPNYINFTDSVYNAMKTLPAAKQNLDNVIIVSTTLKNRYLLQFKSYKDLTVWYAALRLSNFEYSSLQEAYTGALLSARGSRLSDIRTILAEKRFDHEDWVSIRYGSGMAWKRCFAVVEPSTLKKKVFTPGRILFYENEQKKKKQLMAVVTNATAVAAIYPQSHLLIDHSTMLKMEGYINFTSPSLSTKVSKKSASDFKHTSLFLMPEQHSSVPGFDTLIRFLVPLLDSFGLYGRPKRLKANRNDTDSLLFGLPTLPHVHYLELNDVLDLTRGDFLSWDLKTWTDNIKGILKTKIDRGYEGCGSQRGIKGAVTSLSSPVTSTGSPRFASGQGFSSRLTSSSSSQPRQNQQTPQQRKPPPPGPELKPAGKSFDKNVNDLHIGVSNDNLLSADKMKNNHKSVQLAEIYQKYSDLKTPSDNYTDRNILLNGSHEHLMEDELPAGIQQMKLHDNIYPKDDDGLFSDDDDDDDLAKVDVRKIGMNNDGSNQSLDPTLGALKVPYSDDRAGSYSSVISPMSQFNNLKESYQNVDRRAPYPNNSDNESDDDSPPPPVPSHDQKYQTGLQGKLSAFAQDAATSRGAGGMINGSSSESRSQGQQKPKYISSPNSSQNHIHRIHSPEKGSPLGRANVQYPISPERLTDVHKSSDNLADAIKLPVLPAINRVPPQEEQRQPQKYPQPQPQPQSQPHPYQQQQQQPRQQQLYSPQQVQQQKYHQQQQQQLQQQQQQYYQQQKFQQQQQPQRPLQQQQQQPPQQQHYQKQPQQQPQQQPHRVPPPQQQPQQQQLSQAYRAAPPTQQKQPPPQQQLYGRSQPQSFSREPPNGHPQGSGFMQNRGVIPRNNGQAPPPQPQNGTRGFVSQQQQQQQQQQQYQYSYLPLGACGQPKQQQQQQPQQQPQPHRGHHPYGAQYTSQNPNGQARYY